MLCSHCLILQIALDRGTEVRLVLLDFSATFGRVSHRGLLYKLMSIAVAGQFLSIVLEFLCHRSSACVWMVRSLRQLVWFRECLTVAFYGCCCLYCIPPSLSILLGIILRAMRIHAAIPRPLSRPQMKESLNQESAAISSRSLKLHMRLTFKKTRFTVISRSRTNAPGYSDPTLSGAEIEEVKSLRFLRVT